MKANIKRGTRIAMERSGPFIKGPALFSSCLSSIFDKTG